MKELWKNDMTSFSKKISIMSAIGACLVIFIHSYNVNGYHIESGVVFEIEYLISQNIARMAVPFFFMSSAFFQFIKERNTIDVYRKRFSSLVIPYLLWNALYMVAFAALKQLNVVPREGQTTHLWIVSIIKGVLFYEQNTTFWFMYQLILLNLIYPLFKVVLKNKYVSFTILAISTILYLLKGDLIPYDDIYIIGLSPFIYYFSGAILGKFYDKEITDGSFNYRKRNVINILSLILWIITSILIRYFDMSVDGTIGNIVVIRNISLIIFVFGILHFFETKNVKRIEGVTFLIYALHPIILESVEKMIFIFLPHTPIIAIMDYLVAPAITLIIVVLVGKAWKKILPKFYYIMIGQRS